MKKTLVLIRHTKSNRDNSLLTDFDRPITNDRTGDAIKMAAHLKKSGLQPDLIICSPAKRTQQTAAYFCSALNYKPENIIYDRQLYESSADDYVEVLRNTPPEIKTLIMVGHNPSITHFANLFLKEKISHVPTTGVVWIELNHPDWQLTSPIHAELKHFLTPKTI